MVMLGMKGNGHITILVSDDVAQRILGSVARRCRADAAFSHEERLQRALADAVAIRVPAPRSAKAAAAQAPQRKSLLALLRAASASGV